MSNSSLMTSFSSCNYTWTITCSNLKFRPGQVYKFLLLPLSFDSCLRAPPWPLWSWHQTGVLTSPLSLFIWNFRLTHASTSCGSDFLLLEQVSMTVVSYPLSSGLQPVVTTCSTRFRLHIFSAFDQNLQAKSNLESPFPFRFFLSLTRPH